MENNVTEPWDRDFLKDFLIERSLTSSTSSPPIISPTSTSWPTVRPATTTPADFCQMEWIKLANFEEESSRITTADYYRTGRATTTRSIVRRPLLGSFDAVSPSSTTSSTSSPPTSPTSTSWPTVRYRAATTTLADFCQVEWIKPGNYEEGCSRKTSADYGRTDRAATTTGSTSRRALLGRCEAVPPSPVLRFTSCSFCKKNGEKDTVYTGHSLHDGQGRTTCPVLRK